MKKTLLSIIAIAGIATMASAQIEITVDSDPTDISGGSHTYELNTTATDMHLVDFLFHNNTGVTQGWIITRRNVSQPAGWDNFFCWGVEGQIGTCYAASPDEYFDSGNTNISDGVAGLVSTYVTSPGAGTATYRYYVSNDGINYVDSVDLIVNSVLSTKSLASVEVNVAPNPATDYVKVTAEGVESATVKMIDVLGNVILKETIKGSKTIDVSEFRNGIYFVIIEAEGVKTINRKVIVRH